MEQPYWIISDTIIFKPEFNETLDKYIEIISQYPKLIFSNYNDPKIAIKTNNVYDGEYRYFCNYSLFNQPLGNSLSNLINLEQLTFGYKFNQQLDKLLSNLINLKYLGLGYSFNLPLEIPYNIIKLSLDCSNQYIINNLPNNIEELYFGFFFDLELNDLPNSIKKIIFNKNSKYNRELNNLPTTLEYLELPSYYNKNISNIPSNLVTIKCSKNYNYIDDFNGLNIITY
jgi:hypothetical protein